MFLRENRGQRTGAEDVGNDIGNDGEVGQKFKLGRQGRADGHQSEQALHAEDAEHTFDGHIGTGHFGENFREKTALGTGLKDTGQGELPREQGTGAGEDHQAHDDTAGCIAEHVRKGQAEGGAGRKDFRIRYDAGDDVGRSHVNDGYAQGADEGGDRYGFLRIFNGIHIDGRRFQTQEGPERQGDGVAHSIEETEIIRIPRSEPRGRAEPVPADEGNAEDRNDGAPNGDGAQFSRIAGAAEIQGGSNPQQSNGI